MVIARLESDVECSACCAIASSVESRDLSVWPACLPMITTPDDGSIDHHDRANRRIRTRSA